MHRCIPAYKMQKSNILGDVTYSSFRISPAMKHVGLLPQFSTLLERCLVWAAHHAFLNDTLRSRKTFIMIQELISILSLLLMLIIVWWQLQRGGYGENKMLIPPVLYVTVGLLHRHSLFGYFLIRDRLVLSRFMVCIPVGLKAPLPWTVYQHMKFASAIFPH